MSRTNKLRNEMKANNLDAFLVTNIKNVRYLSGFTGTTGLLVVTEDKAIMVTDSRYTLQAKEQTEKNGYEVIILPQPALEGTVKLLEDLNVKKIGIEADTMNVVDYLNIKEKYTAEIVETSNFILEIRMFKEESELEILQKAVDITEAALEHILEWVKPGVSEIEIANELERHMKENGAEGTGYKTIVASGVRGALPHGVASDKKVEVGDMITIDVGALYKGYTADVTRTFALGEPDPKLKEIYQVVYDANKTVLDNAKPGMTCKEVDALARDYITDKGYGENFGHSNGHGLGMDVHELPRVTWTNDSVLEENMVITNEPGIYIEGLGGVRIEDDLVVTKEGVRTLNNMTRELIIIPV